MKKIGTFLLGMALSNAANAGAWELTHHSRANCVGFNESVSWQLGKAWVTWVRSEHINAHTGAIVHVIYSGWVNTWRNAQYHWPEGGSGWIVHGTHWMSWNGQAYVVKDEYTDNCRLYDGWWDH